MLSGSSGTSRNRVTGYFEEPGNCVLDVFVSALLKDHQFFRKITCGSMFIAWFDKNTIKNIVD